MSKKRVNISIDSAVHNEMQRFLDLIGSDFSGFVEMMSVRFLAGMRPVVKRMEAARESGTQITPDELRVMFLQMFGGVNVQAGAEMNAIIAELDTLQAEQAKKVQPVLLETPSSTEVIHTPKPKRVAGAKKK